ncbi:M-phase inducer phosphatase 1-B-like [Alosa alosa]|uniref:M-phase inducer phosphatase 1-B-like n=1 Tax=Alosa alosa TaxID=278164 RepID=UPI0020154014|nr:M-phase inducer phosphatase 1-B-like [Alosa alosa]XP_048113374.1 M-phase inducer phosphatase 1-B-like [Alosa alosa]
MAQSLVPSSAGVGMRGAPVSPQCRPSPMTELTNCFTGLTAFQTGDTPRRCLDLSNISNGSLEEAAAVTSPQGGLHLEPPSCSVVVPESPVPRTSRMKRLRTFLPRLLCSSPKPPPGGKPVINKENVSPEESWAGKGKGRCLMPSLGAQAAGGEETEGMVSPIHPTPPLSPPMSPMDAFEGLQEEGSVNVAMSSSMAQLLSDPLMSQDLSLSTEASMSRRPGRRLIRSPSMPERLQRPLLKRPRTSPLAAKPPIKRHRTISAISEHESEPQLCKPASAEGRHLLKKTLSLCEVAEQQLGGDVNAELIGDFSTVYALPTVTGRHQDLKYISGETMCNLLEGRYSCLVESFVVVDCRYPYEYQGGHIKGALNMPNSDDAVEQLLSQQLKAVSPNKRFLLVLHCEFSSERAPRTCRLLRSVDRSRNEYPALTYPELYILKGGYQDFYHSHKEFCEPQSYCPMHHEDHREELLRCRQNSRVSAEERRRRQLVNRLGKL